MWAIVPRDCPTLTEEEQVALADQQARALMSTLRNFFASEPVLQDKRAVFPNLYENAWGDWEDTTSLASRLISDLHAEWTKVGVASAGQQYTLTRRDAWKHLEAVGSAVGQEDSAAFEAFAPGSLHWPNPRTHDDDDARKRAKKAKAEAKRLAPFKRRGEGVRGSAAPEDEAEEEAGGAGESEEELSAGELAMHQAEYAALKAAVARCFEAREVEAVFPALPTTSNVALHPEFAIYG
jgi:hypothetical protein